MMDLISRQAAIDAVAKWFYDVFGIKESDGGYSAPAPRESAPAQSAAIYAADTDFTVLADDGELPF